MSSLCPFCGRQPPEACNMRYPHPRADLPTALWQSEPVAALSDAQIDAIMEQAQVFASTWSSVGGPFDQGGGMERAEKAKAVLRKLLASQVLK